jgi:hypothetical protein
MTDRKDSADLPEMGFDEALERFIQTDPKELASALERVRQGQAEVERRANQVRENIRRGVRVPGRKLGI